VDWWVAILQVADPERDIQMATTPLSVQQVLLDQAVDTALTMTAQMFGLPKKTVTKIVQVGLPLMAQLAETNPLLCQRMYAAAVAAMPEPIEDFYARMATETDVRQSTMDDYKATFGTMLESVNREAGRQARTTDGQAREVIAAMLPAMIQTLCGTNAVRDEWGFALLLQGLHV
jgi:hypothetical protein